MPDADDMWSRIQDELRRAVDPGAYELWLAPLSLRRLEGTTLTLAAPDERRHWVTERFGRVLQACAASVLGPEVDVDVVGASDDSAPAGAAGAVHDDRGRPGLNPKLTFDQFVIGDANRLAHAAALAVAELPGTAYNPLFVYGPPGVGKTHLLHSIANYIVSYSPGIRVRLTTAERFTNEFISALQSRDVDRFKGAWRSNDVLLIDDVQFLESKAKTEEEFFHTFNALYDAGAQIVLTSDRLPRDLAALDERLRTRFESGLVTDIARPDHATRLAVLRKRAQQDAIDIGDPALLDAIAARVDSSMRELEGALIRVVAFSSLTGRELTPAVAAEVLDGLYPQAVARVGAGASGDGVLTIARIQDVVCRHFDLSKDELLSGGRAARVSLPRQLAMFLAREHTKFSLPAIGAAFGGRNHTTVMHAVRRVEERRGADEDVTEALRELTALLRTDRSG